MKVLFSFACLLLCLDSGSAKAEVVGLVERVTPGPNAADIHGWSCDRNMSHSIDVYLYAGGPAGIGTFVASGRANVPSEPAVSSACGAAGMHRYMIEVPNQTMARFEGAKIYVHGISTTKGASSLLGNSGKLAFSAKLAGNVIGYVDGVSLNATGISGSLYGWACDTAKAQSIDVHFYSGGPAGKGTFVASARANIANESAVDRACRSSGVPHRFSIPLDTATLDRLMSQKIYVHGIAAVPGSNSLLTRSGEHQVPPVNRSVVGKIEQVELQPVGVAVSGWACQMNVSQSIGAHLYAGGPAGTGTAQQAVTANAVQRPDTNKICGTKVGVAHGFKFLLPKKQAVGLVGQKIYVHGIRAVGNYANLLVAQSGAFAMPQSIPFQLSELAKDGTEVIIPTGADVTINKSLDIGSLSIQGRLSCPETGNFAIKTTGIHVTGPGSIFECGTLKKRFAGRLSIALKPGFEIMGTERTLMVSNGGTLSLAGLTNNSQWTRLAATAQPNDREIHLPIAVTWNVGDQVVLAPSNYKATEAEQLTVEAVLNGGKTVRFKETLKFQHWGESQVLRGSRAWTLNEQAEVANLTRNIVIYGDGEESTMDYRGGHVMVMRGAYGYIDAVEFFRMGRMGEMARYPFHWHRAGDVPGQYIVNSSVHRSFQRCITVHGSNKAVVKNNVCFDHFGHGFFLEDGNETENQIIGNLGILSRRPLQDRHLLQSDIDTSNGDRFPGPATFWISNPKNYVADNVAAGSEGTGFWMSFNTALHCSPLCQLPDETHPVTHRPFREQTLQFDGNTAHSVRVGMTWDGVAEGALTKNPRNDLDRLLVTVHYTPPVVPTFRNLTVFKARDAATYVRANTLQFDNFIVADNRVGLFFAYNQVVKNSLVVALSRNHREIDFADNSEFTGMRIYDGPFDLRNVDFVNFPSQPLAYKGQELRPTPIVLYGGANRFTNAVQGLRFFPEPTRRITFGLIDAAPKAVGWADINHTPSLRDIDGSLAGKANTILVPEDPFNDDSSCTPVAGTRSLRCDYQRGLFIFLSIRGNVPWEQTPFVVRRSDGPTTRSFEQLKKYYWNLKYGVILGGRYDYEVTFASDWTMPGKQTGGAWWPNSFQIIFQAEAMGQESPVVAYKGLGENCSILGAQRVDSVEAIRAARGNAYLSAGPVLYAKFVATEPTTLAGSEFAKLATKSGLVQCER